MLLQPFDPHQPPHIEAAAAIWNRACGDDLAITPAFVAFNTRPATGGVQAGWLAWDGDAAAGFALASALPGDPATSPPETGWIDALAVTPACQRRGLGGALLAQAEAWLAGQGCRAARLGGSLRPFAPGLPLELSSQPFFQQRGYRPRASEATVWDVAADLSDPAVGVEASAGVRGEARLKPRLQAGASVGVEASAGVWIAAARDRDEAALLAFLQREFPGRWRFEFEEFRRAGGRMSEYSLLWRQESGRAPFVDGLCRIRRRWRHAVDPLERYFMHRLPPPWGQLGPVGVGQAGQGQGWGRGLIEFSLARLAACGVRGCVIDWTTLLDFYAKFGFRPLHGYRVLVKELPGTTS
jgi:predicted N-acetyltransferase YhbS